MSLPEKSLKNLKMFILKEPQQNSKNWYISKSSKNKLTPTESNRFSSLRSWRDSFAKGTVLAAVPSRKARKPRGKIRRPHFL